MGRDKRNERGKREHFTTMIRSMMETEAWRALSPTAQALYPWLRLEWRGPKNNNNGKIRLSVRQAADRMGIGKDAAARAFQDLQAKGFIVVSEAAQLGVGGAAKSPAFELTELPTLHSEDKPRQCYKTWMDGYDHPVERATQHNPSGINGKPCHQYRDSTVTKIGTAA